MEPRLLSQDFEPLSKLGQGVPEGADALGVGQADKGSEIGEEPTRRLDPTRYGDWEKGDRCIDF